MPKRRDVPVYFYDSNGNIITKDREIRRRAQEGKGKFKFNYTIPGKPRRKGVCIDPETGKPATNSKDAQKIANDIYEADLNDAYDEATKNPTLADFAKNTYLKTILQKRRSTDFYTTHVGVISRAPIGAMRIRKITVTDIEAHLTRRAGEITRRKTQRSGATLNRELLILQGIFRLAIRNGCYSGKNPCREIERFEESGPRTKSINTEQEKLFLAEAYKLDPMLGYIAEIDLRTGLRRAEVCCLRWEWLDFERGRKGYINLPAAICKNKEGRSVPMFENTRDLLLEWMGDEKKTEGPVFRADEGLHAKKRKNISGNIDPVSVGIRISRLCKRLGMRGVTMHVFRHSFATRCLDRGMPPFMVKKWMGHKTLAVTAGYSQTPFDVEENAVAKMEAKTGDNEAKNVALFRSDVPDFSETAVSGNVNA
jgi:integrase